MILWIREGLQCGPCIHRDGAGGSGLWSGYGQGLHAHGFLPDGGDTPVPGPRVVLALWSCGDGQVVSSLFPASWEAHRRVLPPAVGCGPPTASCSGALASSAGTRSPLSAHTPPPEDQQLLSFGGSGQSGVVLADHCSLWYLLSLRGGVWPQAAVASHVRAAGLEVAELATGKSWLSLFNQRGALAVYQALCWALEATPVNKTVAHKNPRDC